MNETNKLQIFSNIEAEMICYKCVCSNCEQAIWLPRYEVTHIRYCPMCHCVFDGSGHVDAELDEYEKNMLKTALDLLQHRLYPNRSICSECKAMQRRKEEDRLKELKESTNAIQQEVNEYRRLLTNIQYEK